MLKNKGNNTCKCEDMDVINKGKEKTQGKCSKNNAKHKNE
jgi:hypothetical protein